MSGLFFTFEGIDGCGKTTQLNSLAHHLDTYQIPYLITREPGGTQIGNQIRQILLDKENSNLVATTEMLLYAADRAQHVAQEILPALNEGKIVLCDRYTDSTLAYQGYGRQLSHTLIQDLNEIATQGLNPHLTFLFDLDIDIAQTRMKQGVAKRGEADRLEIEVAEFHQRVRDGYLEIAKQSPNRFSIIDASQPPTEIFQLLLSTIISRTFLQLPLATAKG